MKEATYEDWQKNLKQRVMWVWDDDEEEKEKQIVLSYVNDVNEPFPVITIDIVCNLIRRFRHCAEIEK